jgi:hypothetical protein
MLARVVDALRAHVTANSACADTERGIGEAWLASVRPAPEPALVRTALRILEREGAVRRERSPDGATLWRSNLSDDT